MLGAGTRSDRVRDMSSRICSTSRPSTAQSRRILDLSMAGYNTVNKNPMSPRIFDALLDLDTRWRLRLVGHPWSPVEPDAPTHVPAVAYGLEFEQRLAQHRARETVMVDPWTADLPAWFQDVGIILSCSDREGSHESVRERIEWGGVGRAELAVGEPFRRHRAHLPRQLPVRRAIKSSRIHRDTRVIGRRSQARPRRACCTAQPRVARSDRRAPP